MGQTTRPETAGASAQDILDFWIDETGVDKWYVTDDALDAAIRNRFEALWTRVMRGGALGWHPTPANMLAAIILFDQFPRNMFRADPRAYASDALARAKAKHAIDMDWDRRIDGPQRQFFYLPLMHSECLADQDRCVRLFKDRMPEAADNLIHARAHREVIRRFGRFPHRNSDLGRDSTAAERAFVETEGGYGAMVNALRAAA
ncbi:DUF924 family protein [Meridianimarinicoccus sp. RP-17]|uniref:DUF924 family protein n=1 Tax=Meridianimarinicoccus zhengii TaxID=2056810 RepID=UPI000DAB9414|nr:DUF924 family protein [Phycocomes zhengii]